MFSSSSMGTPKAGWEICNPSSDFLVCTWVHSQLDSSENVWKALQWEARTTTAGLFQCFEETDILPVLTACNCNLILFNAFWNLHPWLIVSVNYSKSALCQGQTSRFRLNYSPGWQEYRALQYLHWMNDCYIGFHVFTRSFRAAWIHFSWLALLVNEQSDW